MLILVNDKEVDITAKKDGLPQEHFAWCLQTAFCTLNNTLEKRLDAITNFSAHMNEQPETQKLLADNPFLLGELDEASCESDAEVQHILKSISVTIAPNHPADLPKTTEAASGTTPDQKQLNDPPAASEIPPEFDFQGQWQNNAVYFKEQRVANDGDCGFTGLGLTRSAAVTLLLKENNNPQIRALVAPEIRAAFITNNIPRGMHNAAYKDLYTRYWAAQQAINTLMPKINDQLALIGHQRQNTPSMLISHMQKLEEKDLQANDGTLAKLYSELLIVNENCTKEEINLNDYCNQEKTYYSFINQYLNNAGWLTYLRDDADGKQLTSSLDALAQIRKFEVVIWLPHSEKNLQRAHYFKPTTVQTTIHLFHTKGTTHYNILNPISPSLQKNPLPKQKEAKYPNNDTSSAANAATNPGQSNSPVGSTLKKPFLEQKESKYPTQNGASQNSGQSYSQSDLTSKFGLDQNPVKKKETDPIALLVREKLLEFANIKHDINLAFPFLQKAIAEIIATKSLREGERFLFLGYLICSQKNGPSMQKNAQIFLNQTLKLETAYIKDTASTSRDLLENYTKISNLPQNKLVTFFDCICNPDLKTENLEAALNLLFQPLEAAVISWMMQDLLSSKEFEGNSSAPKLGLI